MIANLKTKIKNSLLDTLFPISCLACSLGNDWLCPTCTKKIKIITDQVCPYCEKADTPSGRICSLCKNKFLEQNITLPLDALICAASYQEANLAKIIHFYKYNFIDRLQVPLGEILTKAILENNLPLPDLIIPVPLHPRRERWRGFNQAELLANYISQNLTPNLEIPVFCNIISRIRYTKPQMKIQNYLERQKNMKNIFSIHQNPPRPLAGEDARRAGEGEIEIQNKTILLIDDIATTGSTLFECGKILKQNGAKKVMGAVIARQEIS